MRPETVESPAPAPKALPGMEAGGAVAPGLRPRGQILTRRRRGRAQQHRAEQQRQPDPDSHPALGAAATPGSCRFRLWHHRLCRRRRLAAALPARVSAPTLPRPLCPRAQPIPACRHGVLAQSPRSSRPPPCPAHGVMHWPIIMRCSHTGFPGWATASPTWPQLIGSSRIQPARNESGIPGWEGPEDYKCHSALHGLLSSGALGRRSPPWGVL